MLLKTKRRNKSNRQFWRWPQHQLLSWKEAIKGKNKILPSLGDEIPNCWGKALFTELHLISVDGMKVEITICNPSELTDLGKEYPRMWKILGNWAASWPQSVTSQHPCWSQRGTHHHSNKILWSPLHRQWRFYITNSGKYRSPPVKDSYLPRRFDLNILGP